MLTRLSSPSDLTLVFRCAYVIGGEPARVIIIFGTGYNNMFANSIDSKVNKIKLNVDSYLNDRKKEGAVSQPVPSVRRPEQPSSIPLPSLTVQNINAPLAAPTVAGSQVKPMDL